MIEKKINSFEQKIERCLLAGIVRHNQTRWEVEEHLEELKALAYTAGAEVADTIIQVRYSPDAAYFIGKGKIEEIAMYVEMNSIDLVIFDDELSPAQIRNIEKIVSAKVIDRSALILDIFADHAKTNEAKVQVELAQLNYLLPRLTRQWLHLSRQVGGIGTKGPGETQLETDRRLVRNRISHLKDRLKRIENQNKTQRRQREGIFRAALIGYTNAGKSTLMNALTDAQVLIEDKLFATLDTTVRRLSLDSNIQILLSDTIGFIRKLPHHLVASFRTTLTETLESDLLIHVIDINHPSFEEHIRVVNSLLSDLSLNDKKSILVFNKVDLLKQNGLLNRLKAEYPEALFVSASRHIGIKTLKQYLIGIIEAQYETKQIRLNYSSGSAEHLIHPIAKILDKKSDDQYLYLTVKYPKENESRILALAEKFK
jgi:GTP-binding protein HflX